MDYALSHPGTCCLFLSFGHKEGGRSYTISGQNNYQLQRSITDLPLDQSDDSRGLIMRTANHILQRDRAVVLTVAYFDLVMENIRDLLKYMQKSSKKTSITLSVFEEQKQFHGDSALP